MVVNGIPERKEQHAEPVAAMALDIVQSMDDLRDPSTGGPLTVTIGKAMFVHSLSRIKTRHFGILCIYVSHSFEDKKGALQSC